MIEISERTIIETAVLPAFHPRPQAIPETINTRLAHAIRNSLVYYTIVEYVGHRDQPTVPIGVIVFCPGKNFADVRFCQAALNRAVLPGTHRWHTTMACLGEITGYRPKTLEQLKKEIAYLEFTWWRPYERVLRFRPVKCMWVNPSNLLDRLFEEEIMGNKTVVLDEELAEEIVEEELAAISPAEQPKRNGNAPTVCQYVAQTCRYLKPAEAETALALLSEQEDESSFDVGLLVMKHVMRQINTKPISPELLERILLAWERIPKW